MTSPPVLVLAGPTATGKTAAALTLAKELDAELVGADSVQVYRGFDIGSAKPTSTELGGITHHLIDVVDPDESIDAMAYAARAQSAIEEIHGRGRLPIVVGGTGLWIRALLRGLVEVPPVDLRLRETLEAEAETSGTAALHRRLARVDPETAAAVHPNDRIRIVRGLEVFEQTGIPLGALRRAHALGEPRYRSVFVVLDLDRQRHKARVEERVERMLEGGWVEEVVGLRARWGDQVRALGSVGYREILHYLRDGASWTETRRLIEKATRTYARRQRTWFRGEPGVSWFAEADEILGQDALERMSRELAL